MPGSAHRASVLALLTLAGCDYDVPIYSVYVPPWLLCSIVGSVCAGVLLHLAERSSVAAYIGNRSILFVALTVIFAVLLWAALFKG